MKKLYLLTLLVILPMLSSGQSIDTIPKKNLFSIDAQIRTRGEYRSGLLGDFLESPSDLPTAFINDRVRLGLGYENDWLTLKISGQHTGVWGQSSQNAVNNGDFSIKDAWANISLNKGRNVYLKLGRQELIYDDERILGGLDWHVSGRSHDALKFGYISKNGKHSFDVIGAFNQNGIKTSGGTYFAPGGQPYKHMETAWYHFTTAKDKNPFEFSLLFMNLGFENGTAESPSSRNLQTYGTYLKYKPGKFTLEGSFYYQSGKTALDASISAWMFALKGTCTFSPVVGLSLGLDWLSGQNSKDKYTVFDPLYGTHHKFYGLIDYWYIQKVPYYGLVDPYITLSVNPAKKLNIALTYHAFMTANNAGIDGMSKNEYTSSEVDLQVSWKIKQYLTLMGGYSGLYGGNNFCVNPDNRTQNWVWLQLNINPRIFSWKW